jgi:hypothetical protein
VSNARLRLAFASNKASETMFPPEAPFFVKTWGTVWLMPGEPPGFPEPLPLVRFADKALRAFPTPFHAHVPEAGS